MRGIRLFYSIKWENKNTLYYRLNLFMMMINNGITKPATVDRDNSSMELLMRLKHVMNVIVFQIYKIYTIIPK
ncbi:hypothetical protein RCL_jg17017.t1 [Rhizophagus clarus]|uniref:Uncharacterized protein n=1 Tax=Rhizophagus clarus TaxID=94130 RepID=A0A8H3LPI6_9GLOM|nr:hypothetical protein RCL_jg17017.t1 [Rhizophagus clarus]